MRDDNVKVCLVVVQGRPEGMEIPLPMPQFLIGRDPKCNLRPSSEAVSKLHCAIVQKPGGVFVRDLKSTNGTFVNNDRIHGEVPLNDGDLVRVGPLVLALKVKADAGVGDAAAPSDEEDQAVSWLLDYSPGGKQATEEFGSKTTIMEMSGGTKSEAKPDAQRTKEAPPSAPKKTETPSRSGHATPEVAGDILDRLLSPVRKKKS